MFRRLWPVVLGILACTWALLGFDWASVGVAIRQFDLTGFLLVGVPVAILVFVARSLRWIAVSGMDFSPAVMWRVHVQTALAIATAAATPLQAGEVLKLKLARDTTNLGWHSLSAAFALERLADATVLLGLAVLGFGLRGATMTGLMAGTLVLAALVGFAPRLIRMAAAAPLPARLAALLAEFRGYDVAGWRLLVLGLGTVAKWAGVVILWQAVFDASGISLSFQECAVAVSLVTVSVTLSLVPGGIGVAEVSARAVLLWLGVEPGLADGGAIMLRIVTPLVVVIGLLHAPALFWTRRLGARHG